ncbi:magnesium/cobalt transporter CorA [Caldifermentibacillus hisashii]|uniref:magnesium/cobalt transporter CorA n=1 Tax=Caldifermentibacillus hisashii TaxID=996558 RepID=UPI0031B68172
MIHTIAVTKDQQVLHDISIQELVDSKISWYWVDFHSPTEEETQLLYTFFNFHPLSIEDCLHFFQRPKVDFYEDYNFYVLHTINPQTLLAEEVDIFFGKNFIVSFHLNDSREVNNVFEKVKEDSKIVLDKNPLYIFYLLLDKIVDEYFPAAYKLEDFIGELEAKNGSPDLIEDVFEVRNQLLKLRRTITPMSELLYRILNSERVNIPKEDHLYFMDIYDHLLRLIEIIDSNREMTNDIRDSYISINSYRMNNIMKTLTVLSSIFIPLTFIASIYGMNFKYIPELSWRWGYYAVLGSMFVIGSLLLAILWKKGWFK